MELGHVVVGAALQQVAGWVEQWDRLAGRSSSGHLRVSTPARSSGERPRWGQQLVDNGHTAWREAEWVGLIQQQYGFGYANLARLVPWDQQIQLQKCAKSNPEPDWSTVIGVRGTLVSWREDTWLRFGLHNRRVVETNEEVTCNYVDNNIL